MKKTIAFIIATLGFCSYPDLLLSSLDKYNTLTPIVYIVYVVAVISFAYSIRKHTQDEIKMAYKRAKKTDSIARFEERMKRL